MPGHILMGVGPRVRYAYRVLGARQANGVPALGMATWRLQVERMSAAAGREEIGHGVPFWSIKWDARRRKP
jgi:hypothetical protein